MTLLVAGSANLDFVVRVPHVPAPGETVVGHGLQSFPGGKGANQAVACARAGGVPTQMLLALGQDAAALALENSLTAAGVVLHTVRSAKLPTGTAFISVADDAQNAITVAPGANASLRAEDLPPLHGISHLLMQLEIPLATVAAYARQARAAGTVVVLNAAPAQPLPAELLADVDLLIVNETELAQLVGEKGASVADLLQRIAVPTVIVTLGARGSCARSGGGGGGGGGGGTVLQQPAFAVQAVDTTAAGDTFCGALVAALSLGDTLAAALQRASAAAALACTQPGAQASIPTRVAVDALLHQQRTGRSSAQQGEAECAGRAGID